MNLSTTSACVGGRHVGLAGRPAAEILPPKARPQSAPAPISPAEARAIAALIQTGTSKAAADLLGISPKTMEAHLFNARQKTGHRNVGLLIVAYVRAHPEPVEPLLDLRPREIELIQHLIAGLSRKEAAWLMGISLKTADAHIVNAKQRNDFSTSVQLAVALDREQRQQHQGEFE